MAAPTPLRILAAGSLRRALLAHLAALPPPPPDAVFGPAGLLRQRIAAGEPCDLFLSANLEHPRALAALVPGATVACFARNCLVAVARREVALRADNFLEGLLDPAIRLGTSTPGADPGGDYAWAMFRRAGPAAEALLRAKAQPLVGGAVPAPGGGHPIRSFLADGIVDVFLCYRTTARDLAAEFDIVAPPPPLLVTAEYGSVVLARAPDRRAAAAALAASLLSPEGQACLVRHGFIAAPGTDRPAGL
jgi:ABC-type molybdate transport system substrate-binding protein